MTVVVILRYNYTIQASFWIFRWQFESLEKLLDNHLCWILITTRINIKYNYNYSIVTCSLVNDTVLILVGWKYNCHSNTGFEIVTNVHKLKRNYDPKLQNEAYQPEYVGYVNDTKFTQQNGGFEKFHKVEILDLEFLKELQSCC